MRRSSGFSMVEVLVAFTVLTVAVLALLGGLSAAARQQASSTLTSQALYFAEQKLDELLQKNNKISSVRQSDMPFGGMTGTRQWWGTPVPGNTGVQMVTVEVTWVEGGRPSTVASAPTGTRIRNLSLRSYVSP